MRAVLRFVLIMAILIPLLSEEKIAAQQINSIPSKNSVGDWDSCFCRNDYLQTPSQSFPCQGEAGEGSLVSSPLRGEDKGGGEKNSLQFKEEFKAQQRITWSTPEIVSGFNRKMTDFTPFISPDGLTLYFSSERRENIGIFDIYAATRSRRNEEFHQPYNLGENINSPGAQNLMPTLPRGELEIFFVRNSGGGINSNDIYHATRESRHRSFHPAQPVEEINTAGADFYPWITPDGLTLFFASNRAGSREIDVWFSERATRTSPFDSPWLVSGVNSRTDDFAFSLSGDGSLAYLVSRREDFITANIYTAVADATPGEFQEPVILSMLAGDRFDSSPTVTADGTELYFFSNRDSQIFQYSIWKTTSRPRLPIPPDVPRLWILDGHGRGYMIY